jgi:peptidyl-prolyl cis-trans isomerase B (cyclophilin B)
MKALKVWEKADPAAVKKELPQILQNAIREYKPLTDEDVKKAEKLLDDAAEKEEQDKTDEAVKLLKQIVRMNKDCSLAKKAQEEIDRLESEEKEPGITDVGEEKKEGEDEEAKKEEKEGPSTVIAVIKTDFGDLEIELLLKKAPATCEHFINLVKNGAYEGATFNYVERGKLIQCAPDSSKELPDEIEADFCDEKNLEGAVAMDHGSDRKKVRAAFYITVKDLPERDGEYAVFGRVKNGLIVAKSIASVKTVNYEPVDKVTIRKIEIKE